MHFRYILEPYNGKHSRHQCTECKERDSFSYYIDTETGERLSETVGKCNREIKCGYHYSPKQFFSDHDTSKRIYNKKHTPTSSRIVNPQTGIYSTVPLKTFQESLAGYERNNLISFLRVSFGDEITKRLIETYFIGTSEQ